MKRTQIWQVIFFVLFFIHSSLALASIYYVATDGKDSNPGTIDSPLATLQKAQQLVNPGDTVYVRGGIYVLDNSNISTVYSDLFACISFLDKNGTAGHLINYWNYPGETPVFDFTSVKPPNQRVVGIYLKGSYIHLRGFEMTGIQVTITTHTESYCIYSRGSHNIIENMILHDNKGTGMRHYGGGYNLFLNCDAYRNHDNVSENKLGGNTDGFGCHPSKGGVDNVFRGCRAWFNSDDGFDCIRAKEAVVFDSCQAFYNGYSTTFQSLGDGNGFKAGGYGHDAAADIPNPVPSHTVEFCLAVGNKANGFYSNHHLTGNKWYNNTAYNNKVNYNMVNRESPESDNIWIDGYDHILINNLSYNATNSATSYIDYARNTLRNNSWDSTFNVSGSDFVSLNEDLLVTPRQTDGSLTETDFMRLNSSSNLIDKGVDIGFPYKGSAPDIGAFEYSPPTGTGTYNKFRPSFTIYPNPATNVIYLNKDHFDQLKIVDTTGKSFRVEYSNNKINVSTLPKGIYVILVYTDNQYLGAREFIKM